MQSVMISLFSGSKINPQKLAFVITSCFCNLQVSPHIKKSASVILAIVQNSESSPSTITMTEQPCSSLQIKFIIIKLTRPLPRDVFISPDIRVASTVRDTNRNMIKFFPETARLKTERMMIAMGLEPIM